MSNESIKKASSSSSPLTSASTSSPSSSVDSYIGSFISLTSKYEIRYEGVLYYLNPQESTLGLKNVRSYGTEGRKKDGPQIPPSDKLYEYIMFRGSNIKDLQVKSSSTAQKEELIQNDPAIIQSHGGVGPSSSSNSVSIGVKSYQEPPALANIAHPGTLPSYQSRTSMGPGGPLQATQNANVAPLAMPIYWPECNGPLGNIPYAPQNPNPLMPMSTTATSLPTTVQNPLQPSLTPASLTMGLAYSSDVVTPVPSLNTFNSVHLNITPSPTPERHPTSSSNPYFFSANRSSVTLSPPSYQDKNAIEAPFVGKAGSDSLAALTVHSLPCSVSSVVDSTLGPLLNAPPTLLTPSQLAQSRSPMVSSIQSPYPNQKDMLALNSAAPNLSSSIATPAVQAPLLPLPRSSQQFTEEFDFEAMNEKFKKDKVWGYLGGGKQRDRAEGLEDNEAGQNLGYEGGYGSAPSLDSKPAYNKDEFFDTISCNSLARGPRHGHGQGHGHGQNRFSQRMKQDNETFGYNHQRPHLGYGGRQGENYRGSYYSGREYNYGGRGINGNYRI